MNKEDNKNSKLYEQEIQNKSVRAGVIGILLLSTVFYIVEVVLLKVQNFSWYSIIAAYCAVVFLYRGIKLSHKNDIFLGFIWLLATIACIINYILHRF